MFIRIFLTIVIMSLLEIFVLIKVGGFLGAFPTVAAVVLTALIGTALVRNQGMQLLQDVQRRMAQGETPNLQLIEAVLLLLSGFLLVIPGFVTDFVGLILLQPYLRGRFAQSVLNNIKIISPAYRNNSFHKTDNDPHIIEGEFKRKEDDDQL